MERYTDNKTRKYCAKTCRIESKASPYMLRSPFRELYNFDMEYAMAVYSLTVQMCLKGDAGYLHGGMVGVIGLKGDCDVKKSHISWTDAPSLID